MFKTNTLSKAGMMSVLIAAILSTLLFKRLGFEHVSQDIDQMIAFGFVFYGMERLFKSIILIFIPDSSPSQDAQSIKNKEIIKETMQSR